LCLFNVIEVLFILSLTGFWQLFLWYSGKGLLAHIHVGSSPFQDGWDANLLLQETEDNLDNKVIDMPTVHVGANNYLSLVLNMRTSVKRKRRGIFSTLGRPLSKQTIPEEQAEYKTWSKQYRWDTISGFYSKRLLTTKVPSRLKRTLAISGSRCEPGGVYIKRNTSSALAVRAEEDKGAGMNWLHSLQHTYDFLATSGERSAWHLCYPRFVRAQYCDSACSKVPRMICGFWVLALKFSSFWILRF